MSIYTRKGDRGQTRLLRNNHWQIPKNSLRIRAIGALDESNTFLGLVISFSENQELKDLLKAIQKDLFKISAILAGAKLRFSLTRIKFLEKKIDKIQKTLPELKRFVLPGGSRVGAMIHTARVVTRRAERELVTLAAKEKVDPQILAYINRLSDFLFVLARQVNLKMGTSEQIWQASK